MKAVWAFRVGNFTTDRTPDWSYSLKFNSLRDLCATLDSHNLAAIVGKLAIVAHGDKGGQIQLDRVLTTSSIDNFKEELTQLNRFLTSDGKLIFISCISGLGDGGSALLKALSLVLPGRTVIGFAVYGAISNWISEPGQTYEGYGLEAYAGAIPASAFKGRLILTEESAYAKWALDGQIIRIPWDEQRARKGYRCASPTCPGHAKVGDRCVPTARFKAGAPR